MREPYTQLYIHLVWSTWDRVPQISAENEPSLYAAMVAKCKELKCEPMAIGGTADHVHLLVRFHTTVSIAHLVQEVKGVSSHLVNHVLAPGFKWQGGYGAFTLRKSEIDQVKGYVLNQKRHHQEETTVTDLETCYLE